MLTAAEAAGVKHMVQFTNRGLPHYRYLKRLLEDGYVGEPYHAYFSWPTGWLPSREINPYHWGVDPRRAKGSLNELGSHMIDVARWLLGDVVRVSASLRTFVQRSGPDGAPMDTANDSAFVLLDFASGAHAVIHVGLSNITGPGLTSGQVTIVSGHDGTLETRCDPWTGPQPPVSEIKGLRRGRLQAETLTVPDVYYGGADRAKAFEVFQRQPVGPRLFVDAILHDMPLSPSFHDGHQVQRIVDAAFDAHVGGRASTL
jgi:predicted dehydrogenase